MITGAKNSASIPSRHSNPFATCWTRPGALPFRFVDGQTAEQLVTTLAAQNWWGEIVGPHGSGKSTLLEALKPALVAAGRRPHPIALRNRQRCLPQDFQKDALHNANVVCIIDGYEQLGWLERARCKRRCRRAGVGLLVTAHRATGLPTLIRLAPERALIEQLAADLCPHSYDAAIAAAVAASHECHGSNVREILFDLYDRHELLRRAR